MSVAIRDISDESKGASLEELTVAIRQTTKAEKRIEDAEQLLVSVLKNKPFGLPLTKDEKELLRSYTTPKSEQTAAATSTETTASPEATTSPQPSIRKRRASNRRLRRRHPNASNASQSLATSKFHTVQGRF